MSIDLTSEILAMHADQLNTGEPVTTDAFLAPFPDRREELVPLLEVAARVKRTLKPVKPAAAFRSRLHDGLIMVASHQQAHRILIARHDEPQWGWLLGAAAIGSAAGIIALVLRARAGRVQSPAIVEAVQPHAE